MFSRRRVWRRLSSELLHRIVWCKFTGVSEVLTASIIRAERRLPWWTQQALRNVGKLLSECKVKLRRQPSSRCFLFPVGNGRQDTVFASVDVFRNTSSVPRKLPPRQVLRMWTSENTLRLDILQPVICKNTSKSVGVILTKFLKPTPSFTCKSAKRLSLYLVHSLWKCLVHQILRFIRHRL
jgi:hypothetical protein